MSGMALRRERRAFWICLAAIGLLCAVWARYVLGPMPLHVHDTRWIWSDLSQVYVAWGQYLADPDKRWLASARQSHPLPMSVSLFDPMPLFLLLARGVSWAIPEGLQFIGWYFLACVVLQGVFGFLAARQVLHRLGEAADSRAGLAVAAVIALIVATLPFTFHRFQWHIALSSQWVLVLSIWMALRTLDSPRRAWWLGNGAVVLLATGINPYLTLMVVANLCGITVLRYRSLGWGVALERVVLVCLVAALGLAVFGFLDASGARTGDYGRYSSNILGPMDSNGLARLFPLDIADPTGGQAAEGFNYLGLGVLVLCAAALVLLPIRRLRAVDFPFFPALAVTLACFALALSTTVYIGSAGHHFAVPAVLEDMLGKFRSSGRFFWMSGFWLVFLALASCVLRLGARRALPLLVILLAVQLVDIQPIARHVKFAIADGKAQVLEGVPPGTYSAILVYPPWQCDHQATPLGIRNFESVGQFALRQRIPTNNFYAARNLPSQLAYHCDYPARLAKPDPTAVYLLSDALFRAYGSGFEAGFDCRSHVNGDDSWLCVPRH